VSELQKLQAMIGNKRSELSKLYDDRTKLDKQIARIEGEISGLQDAQSAIDGLKAVRAAASEIRST
jgi:uncharacterized protein YdcH (DUF465 family)